MLDIFVYMDSCLWLIWNCVDPRWLRLKLTSCHISDTASAFGMPCNCSFIYFVHVFCFLELFKFLPNFDFKTEVGVNWCIFQTGLCDIMSGKMLAWQLQQDLLPGLLTSWKSMSWVCVCIAQGHTHICVSALELPSLFLPPSFFVIWSLSTSAPLCVYEREGEIVLLYLQMCPSYIVSIIFWFLTGRQADIPTEGKPWSKSDHCACWYGCFLRSSGDERWPITTW